MTTPIIHQDELYCPYCGSLEITEVDSTYAVSVELTPGNKLYECDFCAIQFVLSINDFLDEEE